MTRKNSDVSSKVNIRLINGNVLIDCCIGWRLDSVFEQGGEDVKWIPYVLFNGKEISIPVSSILYIEH